MEIINGFLFGCGFFVALAAFLFFTDIIDDYLQ
jgi:hypothetical protein